MKKIISNFRKVEDINDSSETIFLNLIKNIYFAVSIQYLIFIIISHL